MPQKEGWFIWVPAKADDWVTDPQNAAGHWEPSLEPATVSHKPPPAKIADRVRSMFAQGPQWMTFLLRDAQKMGGANEKVDPAFSMATAYLIHTMGKDPKHPEYSDPGQTAWCAACGSTLMDEAGYMNPRSAASADWVKSKKLTVTAPYFGASMVLRNYKSESLDDDELTGKGHLSHLVGISPDGKWYIGLGGNQGNTLKFSKYKVSGFTNIGAYGFQHFDHFAFPANYNGPKLKILVIPISQLDDLNHAFGIHPEAKKQKGAEPTQ
jgi:hypothetical protein